MIGYKTNDQTKYANFAESVALPLSLSAIIADASILIVFFSLSCDTNHKEFQEKDYYESKLGSINMYFYTQGF